MKTKKSNNIRLTILTVVYVFGTARRKISGNTDHTTTSSKKSTWNIQRKTHIIAGSIDRNAFCYGLHLVESKRDNYLAYNPRTSALGRYQFLPRYFRDDIVRVTGATSHQDFLTTPEYQEIYMDHHIRATLVPGLKKLKKTHKNTSYSDVELLSLVHFLWARGAGDFLTNKQMNANQQVGNVSAEKYLEIVNRGVREYG